MSERQDVVRIDEDRLDQEWLRHPGNVLRHADDEADARDRHARAKAELDLLEAELQLEVRAAPGAYGLPDKPNNDIVAAAVTKSKRYRDALFATLDLKHELDLASNVVLALVDKRKGLERLCELHVTGYHSEPKPKTTAGAEAARGYRNNAPRAPIQPRPRTPKENR